MPYKSQAQAGYFHTHAKQLAKQGVDVSEWDQATKGKHLPKRAADGGHMTGDVLHQAYQERLQQGLTDAALAKRASMATGPNWAKFEREARPSTNIEDNRRQMGGEATGVGRAEQAVHLAKRMAAGGFDPMGKPGASAMGQIFEGPIRTGGAGRTDVNKHDVASGSYVVPADAVSISGDGNTEAGFKFFKSFFKPLDRQPLDLTGGMKATGTPMKGMPEKPGLKLKPPTAKKAPGGEKRAEGGVDGGEGTVPIIDAGGEIVVPPRLLQAKFGELDHAHNVMDEIVKLLRSQEIERLKSAPPPKK